MIHQQNEEQKVIKAGCALMVCKYHLDALPNLFRDVVCSELDISVATFYRKVRQGHLIDVGTCPEKNFKAPFNKAEDKAIIEIFKNFTMDLRAFAESKNYKDTGE